MPAEIDDLPDDRPVPQQNAASDAASTTPAAATPPDASPAPDPSPASPAAQSAPATPAAASGGDPATTQAAAQAQAQGFATVRDYAKSLGHANAGQYPDDHSFIQAMIAGQNTQAQQLAEAKRLAQFGQMWLAQQAQQAQVPAATNAKPDPLAMYKAPEFDQRWLAQITKDPTTGALSVAPGADPTILPKFLAYQQHREKVTDQFLQDPVQFLKPLISSLVGQQGQELVEQRLAQMQEQQYADSFINTNRSWLYANDSTGRPILNPATNQPMLSPIGQRFTQHMQFGAQQLGIQGSAKLEHYARTALAAEMAQPAAATQAAVQTGAAAQQNVLNAMNRNPNRSGSQVGPDNTGHQAPAVQNASLSLRDQLAAAFASSGITDADIVNDPR
jgi:hypothetical protein